MFRARNDSSLAAQSQKTQNRKVLVDTCRLILASILKKGNLSARLRGHLRIVSVWKIRASRAARPVVETLDLKFTVCAVVLSHRNAERTASSSGAAPAAAPRVHTAPAHGLLPVLAHTLHALPYYPKTVVGIYCCITVLLLFWPEVQAAVASVADRFRAAEWQPIEVVPYSSPFSEEELKELDADPELEALR